MPLLTEEQQKAAESIDEHVLVSAGAGSGKTMVLVERFIQVLQAFDRAGINDIIAVTFTRKAADEMRSRLKTRLGELVEQSSGDKRQRWLDCLAQVEYARIGTIHSLCESILKNFPAEAGIDPGFEILDDLERAELIQASIEESLHSFLEKQEEFSGDLLDYPLEDLREWLGKFLASPLQYKEARIKFGDGSLESMQSFAVSFVEAGIRRTLNDICTHRAVISEYSYLRNTPWRDPSSKLGLIQDRMLSHLPLLLDGKNYGWKERLQALQALASIESPLTSGGKPAEELRKSMSVLRKAARDTVKHLSGDINEADNQAFSILHDLIMLADDALFRYELLKQFHQKLDFDDLIQRCQELLTGENCLSFSEKRTVPKGKSRLAISLLKKNLRAVLVDEFQDTNWTQARLLTALSSAQSRLFLIGDDKQSIYKFQGADVSTFNACKTYVAAGSDAPDASSTAAESGLPPLPGKGRVLTLSQSFRSHPQIVNFVNHLFRSLFDADPEAEEYKSRFQDLRPARSSPEGDDCPRIDITYTPCLDKSQPDLACDLKQMDFQLTAEWILAKVASRAPVFDKEKQCSRPVDFADFAVLLQANSEFAAMERALSQAGIPFVSVAGSGFLLRQEIIDLENLLKWLSCPQDSQALFAVLRSPIFGLSDDILHDLKAGKKVSLFECLSQKCKESGQDDLLRVKQALDSWLREARSLSLADLVRKIVLASGYDMILLNSPGGRQKSRNVFRFVSLVCQYKHMSLPEFLKALDCLRKLKVKNLTDAPLSADNAVKIMTVHKSKGLEFAAVALPRLARSVQAPSTKLLLGKDMAIALDCTRDSDAQKPAFYKAAGDLCRRLDEEEKKRLFYVALTRARDYLGLFITPRCRTGTNMGKWLIQGLGLPEAGSQIEPETMSAGKPEERCCWNILQAGAGDVSLSGAVLDELSRTAEYQDSGMNLTVTDYSLLKNDFSGQAQTFVPVPWQYLLRACPDESKTEVHATIAGNYFHLLMSHLGPDLEFPSEKDQRALLLSPEVSVHDIVQQELLLHSAAQLLATFKNSSLYRLLKTAKRRIVESAYLIRRDEHEEELRPDLIVEDKEGGWHIVDYKTDQVLVSQISRQVSTHQEQLCRYAHDLETLLSVKAKAWIYFAQIGRLVPVDLSLPPQLSLF